jgi:hypothetical protein
MAIIAARCDMEVEGANDTGNRRRLRRVVTREATLMQSFDRRMLLLGAATVLVIDLFLSWQQACGTGPFGSVCASRSGWHGIGVLVGLLAIVLIVLEAVRLYGQLPELPVPADLLAAGLAAATAVLAVLEFLSHNEARHWPAWIGLLAAIALGIGAWLRLTESGTNATTPPPAPGPAP